MNIPVRKSLLFLLFLAMLWESFFAPSGSNPGRVGGFILAWAIGTRQFLATPSYTLTMFALLSAGSCLGSNYGLLTGAPVVPRLAFYLICGIVIMWWEKIVGLFRPLHNTNQLS
jgi:hypothetical protein